MLETLDERGELDAHAQPEVFYIDPKKGLAGLAQSPQAGRDTADHRGDRHRSSAGGQTVASLVQFIDGLPFKPGYRRYKIRDVQGIDDYRSIHEVVSRRYRRLYDESEVFPGCDADRRRQGTAECCHGGLSRTGNHTADTDVTWPNGTKRSFCQGKRNRCGSVGMHSRCDCCSTCATNPTVLRSITTISCDENRLSIEDSAASTLACGVEPQSGQGPPAKRLRGDKVRG